MRAHSVWGEGGGNFMTGAAFNMNGGGGGGRLPQGYHWQAEDDDIAPVLNAVKEGSVYLQVTLPSLGAEKVAFS